MRYFVTQIVTVDGSTAIATTEKSDLKEAKMLFHQIIASAYAQPNLEYALIYIDNELGNREELEQYKYVAPYEPEPESEPEENSEGLTTE